MPKLQRRRTRQVGGAELAEAVNAAALAATGALVATRRSDEQLDVGRHGVNDRAHLGRQVEARDALYATLAVDDQVLDLADLDLHAVHDTITARGGDATLAPELDDRRLDDDAPAAVLLVDLVDHVLVERRGDGVTLRAQLDGGGDGQHVGVDGAGVEVDDGRNEDDGDADTGLEHGARTSELETFFSTSGIVCRGERKPIARISFPWQTLISYKRATAYYTSKSIFCQSPSMSDNIYSLI